jgi:hypothetical protein
MLLDFPPGRASIAQARSERPNMAQKNWLERMRPSAADAPRAGRSADAPHETGPPREGAGTEGLPGEPPLSRPSSGGSAGPSLLKMFGGASVAAWWPERPGVDPPALKQTGAGAALAFAPTGALSDECG